MTNRELAENRLNEEYGIWVLSEKKRETLIQEIIKRQDNNLKYIQERKEVKVPYLGWNVTPLVDFFGTMIMPTKVYEPELQEQIDKDTYIKGLMRSEIAKKNEKIGKAIEALPSFERMPKEKKDGFKVEIIKALNELMEIRYKITKAQEVKDVDALKELEKEKLSQLEQKIEHVIELSDDDNEFGLEQSLVEKLYETAQQVINNPTAQGIAAGFSLGFLLGGAKSFFGAMIFGVAGAVTGAKYPQIRHVFTPFIYLYKEIKDIATKRKSYMDRAFRGGMILLATIGVIAGVVAIALLVGNPFTGVPILGIAAVALTTVLVAAAAAKISKWISRKVSERVYGMYDSDRFDLTKEAKVYLGDDAKRVHDYFLTEVKNLYKDLKKIEDKSSLEAIRINNHLQSLESTWKKIQAGQDCKAEWKECAKGLYRHKKGKYVGVMHKKTGKRVEELPGYLLHNNKNKNTFAYLDKKGGKIEKSLEDIKELKDINNKLKL